MDQGDGALTVRVRQIGIELPQLLHQKHSLIDNRPAGERGDIGIDIGLFKYPPDNIQPPVELQTPGTVLRALHEAVADMGHTASRLLPQHLRMDRHVPPAQELQSLLVHNDLQHLLGLGPPDPVLGEEEHPHAIIPFTPQSDSEVTGGFYHQPVGHLEQQAHAVAGLSGGVLSGAVLQLFHDF